MDATDSVIAVFADHQGAEAGVKHLAAAGFDVKTLSVVGKGFHIEDKVVGFLQRRRQREVLASELK